MTEIKKTALRLKKPPCNSEDDVPPRNVEHPEKEGKKRKIDEVQRDGKELRRLHRLRHGVPDHPENKWVYDILEIEEEKGKLKELNLVQQLRRVEEIHENNKKLQEICSRDRDGAGGTRNPAYGKYLCDRITLSGLCDTVKECISVEKKELQLIEQRFEKLLAKINKEDPEDDETHPASVDLTDTDDTDKDTLEDLKKRVTDAEFKLTRFIGVLHRDAETAHFGMEKLNGRVDDLSKSVKDLEEWKNAAHEPKKAPEEGQGPGSRIQSKWEIHPGRKVWVYSPRVHQRKPGVVKKVNPKKAIVNMADAEGKMTDYDVPFSLIGLRDE